jgi:pimeloyl-ACP methyl ester carboxylesterase
MRDVRGYSKPNTCGLKSHTPKLIRTRVGDVEAAVFGNPTGPALILLPHGLGDWSSLLNIALDLAILMPDLRLVALSRPGCGGTPSVKEGAADPLRSEASTTLPALMDALDISAAHLVGHADGASVALIFAGLFPHRALGVVGLAPYCFADDYLRTTLEAMPSRAEGPHSLSNFPYIGDPDIRFLRWREDRLWECKTRWNATKFLDGISMPVTLVQGARDEFISLDQAAAIGARIQGDVCWITLQNAGHFVHIDNPQQIVMLVQRQLKQACRATFPSAMVADDGMCRPNWSRKVSEAVRVRVPDPQPLVIQDERPTSLLLV